MATELEVGLRVVRGPDWEWGEQDGGEGCVGTVAEVDEAVNVDGGRPVVVQWDYGERCRYRCGVEGKYDLRVLDSAPTGLVHPGIACSWCDENPLSGMVWKCAHCWKYYLCTPCYMSDRHVVDHEFDCSQSRDLTKRVRRPPRFISIKLTTSGIFSGAEVVRGYDWEWSDQDGGCGIGHVTDIQGWKMDSQRSVAMVKWTGTNTSKSHNYRRGHHGKVDLKCVTPSSGGNYYPLHLPILGCKNMPLPCGLTTGDSVEVQVDPDQFRVAQENHGGWNIQMAEYIGRVGVVVALRRGGSVVVRYSNSRIFVLNKNILTKVDVPIFSIGDTVRVLEDIALVHTLQLGHGEWNDDIALALGQVGKILKVMAGGDLRVSVNGRRWTLNPKCLHPAPYAVARGSHPVDEQSRLRLLSMIQAGIPNVVPAAAQAGDASVLKNYLEKHPHEVNSMEDGKGALNIAVVEDFMPVLETLLEFKPNLETMDGSGERPLHVCCLVENAPAARLLLDAGADVNATNCDGVAPIILATGLGCQNVLEALLESPFADLSVQDCRGMTALHRAVLSQHHGCTKVLLERGADPCLLNFELSTALHMAVGLGFLVCVEEILRYHPHLVNMQKDDGYSPLHMAAANGHCDLLTLIASHPSCDLNIQTKQRLTALHISAHEGHVELVEKLVGFGADLSVTSHEGNTPLHIVLGKRNMALPSIKTPQIKKIQEDLEVIYGRHGISANIVVGLFLVANGADVHVKNLHGMNPLVPCSPDIATLVRSYVKRNDSYHGSLRGLIQTFEGPPKPIRQPQSDDPPVSSAPLHPKHSTPVAISGAKPHTDVHPLPATPPDFHRSASVPFKQAFAELGYNDEKLNINTGSPKLKYDKGPSPQSNDKGEKKVANLLNNKFKDLQIKKEVLCCFLCEAGADIKLMPCSHVTLCHDCLKKTKAIKKCPNCRVAVDSWKAVCVLCQRGQALSPMDPCGHTYCADCKGDLEYCEACRQLEEKGPD